jgi:hypothetical protein
MMKKYTVTMKADIYTTDLDNSDFWNRFGNQFSDDFYTLLNRYTGNTYLFRNTTVDIISSDMG